jgi:hypothetical protein
MISRKGSQEKNMNLKGVTNMIAASVSLKIAMKVTLMQTQMMTKIV